IGTNVAHRLLSAGESVLIFDNLCRPGVERNLQWLRRTHGERVLARIADISNIEALQDAVAQASRVFHFAAQVAVTTSMVDPVLDFRVNLGGAMNLLEALRRLPVPPPLLFTSTNKVYGGLEDIPLRKNGTRYCPLDPALRTSGVSESRPLSFC